MNLDFWLSSGNSHFWNPGQAKPATAWEARIDELTRQQVQAHDPAERQRLFLEVQRVFGQEVPALYFVAPKVTIALSPRVRNVTPAPQIATAAVERRHARGLGAASPAVTAPSRAAETTVVTPHLASFILRRAAAAVLLVLVVSSAAVVLARLAPGDHLSEFD